MVLMQDPTKRSFHFCIVNLVIGTLYCVKGNYEFGIARIIKSMEPESKKLETDTWFYAKRCFLALFEGVAKHMITLKVSQHFKYTTRAASITLWFRCLCYISVHILTKLPGLRAMCPASHLHTSQTENRDYRMPLTMSFPSSLMLLSDMEQRFTAQLQQVSRRTCRRYQKKHGS